MAADDNVRPRMESLKLDDCEVVPKTGDVLIATIQGSETKGGSSFLDKAYTSYKVFVQHKGSSWMVNRRFSEFVKLHDDLVANFGQEGSHARLKDFPAKKLTGKMDEAVVQERLEKLNAFLQLVVEDAEYSCARSTKGFLKISLGDNW